MSNEFFYKFKNDPVIYKGVHSCTAHLRGRDRWKYDITKIISEDKEYPTPSYMVKGDLTYGMNDVEWFEYRVNARSLSEDCSDLIKRYSTLLSKSSIKEFLHWHNENQIAYRFTTDHPYKRMLFIVSLMRYCEEYPDKLSRLLDTSLVKKCRPDKALALISSRMSAGHGVFHPPYYLQGIFHRLDEFYDDMLGGTSKVGSDVGYGPDDMPSASVSQRFKSGEYTSSFSIQGVYNYFNREVT